MAAARASGATDLPAPAQSVERERCRSQRRQHCILKPKQRSHKQKHRSHKRRQTQVLWLQPFDPRYHRRGAPLLCCAHACSRLRTLVPALLAPAAAASVSDIRLKNEKVGCYELAHPVEEPRCVCKERHVRSVQKDVRCQQKWRQTCAAQRFRGGRKEGRGAVQQTCDVAEVCIPSLRTGNCRGTARGNSYVVLPESSGNDACELRGVNLPLSPPRAPRAPLLATVPSLLTTSFGFVLR